MYIYIHIIYMYRPLYVIPTRRGWVGLWVIRGIIRGIIREEAGSRRSHTFGELECVVGDFLLHKYHMDVQYRELFYRNYLLMSIKISYFAPEFFGLEIIINIKTLQLCQKLNQK